MFPVKGQLFRLLFTINFMLLNVSTSSSVLIKQSHLIKTGFTNIIWEYIDSNDFKVNNNLITKECKLSLNYVNQSLSEGKHWPIKCKLINYHFY